LEAAARAFQDAVLADPATRYVPGALPEPVGKPGSCILFTDALRFDAARRLAAELEAAGYTCQTSWTLAALPTITPTAKPAISPAAGQFAGGAPGLTPVVKASGAPATAAALRKLLEDAGYSVLPTDGCGDPTRAGWAEAGAIDQYGHGHGWKVAHHLLPELKGLAERIAELLSAGWKRIIVITDHGWLMLPGGLPKVELPSHLTLARKGRCAVLKPGAQTGFATVPWRWDPAVAIAVPPGIACFEAGLEYEHGGLSPQECVVPIIEITAPAAKNVPAPTIRQVSWRGLRCRVELEGAGEGMAVDIRTKAADAATSIVDRVRQPGADGTVSLLVPDDDRLGEAAFVVVLSDAGVICVQALTTVGG
jgi:hypothetical protein